MEPAAGEFDNWTVSQLINIHLDFNLVELHPDLNEVLLVKFLQIINNRNIRIH